MSVYASHGADVSGTYPSPSIWGHPGFNALDCLVHRKGTDFWDDFKAFDAVFAVAANIGRYCGPMGSWISYEDTGDAISQLATDSNGVAAFVIAATNTTESWIRPGSATSVGFVPKTKANGGKSILFEARVNMSTLVGNMFVGLTEEGLAAANTIADANGTLADKDYIGFLVDEDAPTVCRFVASKAGGTAVNISSSAHTFVADTFVKLGFIIDMEEPDDNKRVKGFVNGVDIGSYLTNSQYEDTTNFPTGEELHVLFGGKNNNATKTVRIDWVRVGQMKA